MPIGLRRTVGVVGLAVAITVGAMAAGPQTAAVRAIGSSAASGTASRTAMPPRSPAPASNGPVAPPLGDLAAIPTGGIGDWPPARSTDPAPGATVGADRAGADRQVGSHWRLIVHDDFAIDAGPGAFLSTYRDFGAYPWGWLDTSKRGHYDPDILSVSGGILTMHMHTTADGIHHVAAPYPKLPGGGSNQLYGRYSVRFRADPVDGYKVAWLLWPGSQNWDDGEIDFPEGDLTRTISAFMHHVGDPSEQDNFGTGVGFAGWHVATIEWSPGKVAFLFDGRILGTSTQHVPAKPMHFVLQTETELGFDPVPSTTSGDVQLDWVSIWRYE